MPIGGSAKAGEVRQTIVEMAVQLLEFEGKHIEVVQGSAVGQMDVGRDSSVGADAGRDSGVGADAGRDSGVDVDAGRDSGMGVDAGRDSCAGADTGRDSGAAWPTKTLLL